MITPDNNNLDGKPTIINDFREENKFASFLKHFFVFLLLVGVIVASFWVSFLLGKRILVPAKKTPKHKIEVAIPEPPPSIAGLQKIEDVPKQEEAKVGKTEVKKIVKKVKTTTEKYYPAKYYRVQAGVFKSKANASNLSKKLNAKGFQTCVKNITLKDLGQVYRVQVGVFKSRAGARDLQRQMIKQGFEAIII